MDLPTDNASRSHAEVRQNCIDIQDMFLDLIFREHQSISGRLYDRHATPEYVGPNLENIATIRRDLREYETSDLLKVYFSRATDGGDGGRENIQLIHTALEEYESAVHRAIGSGVFRYNDSLRPTGGGLARRTGLNELTIVRDTIVPMYQRSLRSTIFGTVLSSGRDFLGNKHVKIVQHFDNMGRATSTQIYDKDCFGNPYKA